MTDERTFALGDIYYVDLPTEEGSSVQGGRRPVCILGNPKGLFYSPTVNVVPFTTQLKKQGKIPCHILTHALERASVMLPEQIQTVSKDCVVGSKIGHLEAEEIRLLKEAILFQLGFSAN